MPLLLMAMPGATSSVLVPSSDGLHLVASISLKNVEVAEIICAYIPTPVVLHLRVCTSTDTPVLAHMHSYMCVHTFMLQS